MTRFHALSTSVLALVVSGCASSPRAIEEPASTPSAFVRLGPGEWRVRDDARELSTRLSFANVSIESAAGRWSMHLAAFGRASAMTALPGVVPVVDGDRAIYRHPGLTEWYTRAAAGLEQGFDVAERPSGTGPLRLELASEGLVASLADETITLSDAAGVPVLHYGQLRVVDAKGAPVPAHLELATGRIVLVIDDADARYPLAIDPLVWGQQAKLRPADPTAVDGFGVSAVMGSEFAVIGADGFGPGCTTCKQGAVYSFVRTGGSWAQESKLTAPAPDGAGNDTFGGSLALSGDTLVVGARGVAAKQGGAYVYLRSGSTWTLQAKLKATDAAAGDGFGTRVAIEGDTAIVGAYSKNTYQGAAYVFVRSGTTWTQQAKLTASDGASNDYFGGSVALNGDTAIVGAVSKGYKGQAYAFVRSGTTWSEQAIIAPGDVVMYDGFSTAVALVGDTALISAPGRSASQGTVYTFTRSGTTWTEGTKITPDDGAASDFFGVSILLTPTAALIGSQNKQVGTASYAGAGYLFARSGATFTQQAKLVAADAAPTDYLSKGAAMYGDSILLGAMGKNAAYVFVNRKSNGDACTAGLDCVSGNCVESVCCDTVCSGTCMACVSAKTGATTGHCAPITDGTDPRGECGATTCTAGVVEKQVCDGYGGCRSAKTNCAPFVCSATTPSCLASCTADTDCDADHYCKGSTCVVRKAGGDACGAANECTSGSYCVDGVCCDAPCEGQCAACDVPGLLGKCAAVTGAPHGKRAACVGGGPCGGSCDGKTAASCTFPDARTACDKGCSDAALSTCDGKGGCQPPRACSGNLTCESASKCRTSCSADADCLAGFRCKNGGCVAARRKCSEDGKESIDTVDGSSIACAPYQCDSATSACRKSCEVSSDCAAGFSCDPGTKTCIATVAAADDPGGCSVGAVRSTSKGSGLLPVIAGLWMAARRVRRSKGRASMLVFGLLVALLAACSTNSPKTESVVAASGRAFTALGSALVARHAGLAAVADVGGMAITDESGSTSWKWSMRLARVGRVDRLLPVAPSAPRLHGSRASYTAGSVTEWYVVNDAGVEQGFDLAARPEGSGELVLELATAGLSPVLSAQTVSLRGEDGGERLRYGELHVVDALGRKVPSRITLDAGRIALRVDDSVAQYPLVVDPLIWGEQSKLQPTDLAASDRFGGAVALSGDTALVGASYQKGSQGAAYVFVRSGATWTQQAKLVAADGAANEYFGGALALNANTAMIAAPSQTSGRGAVYVFVRSGTTWTQQAKLLSDDGAANDQFGGALALEGDTAVIGAPYKNVGTALRQGATYVFQRSGTTWTQLTKLDPVDAIADDHFGNSIALAGDTAMVSAPFRSWGKGVVYVFLRTAGVWSKQTTLVASDGIAGTAVYLAGDIFGGSLSLSGNTALISAPNKQVGTVKGIGQVYVFNRTGTTWSEDQRILASDGGAEFGSRVSISGDRALASSPKALGGRGKIYTLARSGTTWSEGPVLTPSDASPSDSFGQAVWLDGDTAIGGAVWRNSLAGAAFVFANRKAPGDACTAASDCLSGLCVDSVCCPSDCTGRCMACASTKTGKPDGTCAPVLDNTDPHADCPAATCTSGLATVNVCDGTGGCRAKSSACSPYLCDGAAKACLKKCTADTDCIADDYCSAGACVSRKSAGKACGTGNECVAGLFCADGVCCNAPCDGQCEACDATGFVGKCTTVIGKPHGARTACLGAGTTCGGACDGKTAGACIFPDTTIACEKGCADAALSTCDGKGACQAPVKCAKNLTCEDDKHCRITCTEDSHCLEGFGCRQGECIARSRVCSDDRKASVDTVDDSRIDCVAYACDPSTGKCGTTCATTTDCVAGYLCNAGVCEKLGAEGTPGGADSGDTGCQYGASTRAGGSVLALLGLFLLARRRR